MSNTAFALQDHRWDGPQYVRFHGISNRRKSHRHRRPRGIRLLSQWMDLHNGKRLHLAEWILKKPSRSANSLEKEEVLGKMTKIARKIQEIIELGKRSILFSGDGIHRFPRSYSKE